MNNQQKYLGIGITSAIGIVALVKVFLAYGMDNNSWMILMSMISAGMTYLVFNIFVLTLTLVPVKNTKQQAGNNKLQ